MRVLETQIDVDATPEQVWDVLTDFEHYGDWNPFITSIEGALEQGARLAVRIAPPGARAMTLKPTVRHADANRRLGWLGHLGVPRIFDGAHEFVIEARADGTTSFTQRETFRGVLVPLCGRVLDHTRDGFEEMNRALKERVESSN